MPWGSLSSAHRILVTLSMRGGPQYAAQAQRAAAQTNALGAAVLRTSANMQIAGKRTWAHNQALYTARRYAFYATLAFTALGVAVARLGFSYLNAMQTARVALRPAFKSTQDLNKEINTLYVLAAQSPFLFKDTLGAFRTAYPAFKAAGLSVALTNQTMAATMDALSEAGRATPAALGKVSVQLQHMANIGRPTGQVLLALARDGLPVYPALRKELHLTGTSLAQLANSGYSAGQVIRALNKYIETSKLYKGAALRQANYTLQGSWQQFKDMLSQGVGRSEAGAFGGLHKTLRDINYQLTPLLRGGKPITLYNIAQAIDHSLTPRSHVVINTFIILQNTIKTTIAILGTLAATISYLFRPLDFLGSLFGANRLAAHLFGIVLGTLIALMIIDRTATITAGVAQAAWHVIVVAATAAGRIYAGVLWLITAAQEFQAGFMGQVLFNRFGTLITSTSMATRAGYALRNMYIASLPVMRAVALASWRVTAALLSNPYLWLALGLTILYFKWKGFRDIVNKVWHTIIFWSPIIAAALTYAFGPLGAAVTALMLIIRYHKFLGNMLRTQFLAPEGRKPPVSSHSKAYKHENFFQKIGQDLNFFSGLASGGTIRSAGGVIVGERGPELLNLPRAATVSPLKTTAFTGGGTINIRVYPQDVYIGREKVATVMATAVTDAEARL